MNILDSIEVIPQQEISEHVTKKIRQLQVDLHTFYEFGYRFAPEAKAREDSGINQVARAAISEINRARLDLLVTHGSVGELVHGAGTTEIDAVGKLAESPKTTTSSLRALADSLGFVIIPFDYLNPRSWEGELKATQERIKAFSENSHFQTFVLCPVDYYSLEAHVRGKEDDQPIYTGRHEAAFLPIQMAIPVFRTIFGEVENVRNRVGKLEERIKTAETNISTIARHVETLAGQVAKQQREIALQAAKEEKLRRELEGLKVHQFRTLDPLLFAVPPGINPGADDSWVAVGPCWGPDLPDIVFHALRLPLNGKRRELEQQVKKIW